jgi:hypothetical protein
MASRTLLREVQMKTELAVETMKGAPAVVGAAAAALTLNQIIAIATGIYIVIQAAYLLRKWYREEQVFKHKYKKLVEGKEVDLEVS